MISVNLRLRDPFFTDADNNLMAMENPIVSLPFLDCDQTCDHSEAICEHCTASWAADWSLESIVVATAEGTTTIPVESWSDLS